MHETEFRLDIEQRLFGGHDGNARAMVLKQLETIRERLLAQRRQLGSRDRQRQLVGAQAAVEGAIDAVRRIVAKTDANHAPHRW